MRMQVVTSGHDELIRAFDSMSKRVSTQVQRDALKEGAAKIQARASALAPRDPGAPDLADNINVATVRSTGGAEASVGIGSGTSFYYDWFQEFGTSRQAAHPFYRPAIDQEGANAIKVIGASLWAAIIKRGFGSSRVGQGSSESFAGPSAPMVMGGFGSSLL